ncbi:putative minor capsid protein [Bacillus sp. FSL K6-3431]|uniref:putative minor capsid protein n=1 Tax=Bacillus sp. FSL K6-3431 TaxID=2921500 RepID=UPI0030FBEC44
MRIGPLPKKWLIHSIVYKGFTGKKDDFGKPVYDPPITIEYVRYDESSVFSRDNTQTKILADGVIFVDTTHSKPIPVFKEESKITFNDGVKDRELTLKKIVPCYYPNQNKVHHYELEVI